MMNPWEVNNAFDAMFTDTVEIHGVRPQGSSFKGVFSSCVYPVEKEDPFDGNDADTDIMKLVLLVNKRGAKGWYMKTPPQIGDTVKTTDGKTYKVNHVSDTVDWYQLEAKSC